MYQSLARRLGVKGRPAEESPKESPTASHGSVLAHDEVEDQVATNVPAFLTYDAIERVYGIPAWKTKKWVWSGRLAAFKVDGPRGRTYIDRDEFLALMMSSRTDAVDSSTR
jgi:hypothetical protein